MFVGEIDVSYFRKLLPAGTAFIATFIGSLNMRLLGPANAAVDSHRLKPPEEVITYRVVTYNGRHELTSRVLSGPAIGDNFDLVWEGLKVLQVGETGQCVYVVYNASEPFLLINLSVSSDTWPQHARERLQEVQKRLQS